MRGENERALRVHETCDRTRKVMESMDMKHVWTRLFQLGEELDGRREVIVLARSERSDPMNRHSIGTLLNLSEMPRWVRGYYGHVLKEFARSLRHLRDMGLYSPNVRRVSRTHQHYTIHETLIASLTRCFARQLFIQFLITGLD